MTTRHALSLISAALVVTLLGTSCTSIAREKNSIEYILAAENTPEDHAAIIAYYQREAEAARKNQAQHERMRALYAKRAFGPNKHTASAAWCEAIAARYGLIAADNEELARNHQQVAHHHK